MTCKSTTSLFSNTKTTALSPEKRNKHVLDRAGLAPEDLYTIICTLVQNTSACILFSNLHEFQVEVPDQAHDSSIPLFLRRFRREAGKTSEENLKSDSRFTNSNLI